MSMFSGGELEKYAARWLWKVLWLVIIVSVVIGACIGFLVRPALAQPTHDPNDPNHWYEAECCSLQDCKPMTPAEYFFDDGEIVIVETGERFPLDALRNSQDGSFHRCAGLITKKTLIKGLPPRVCIYAPPSI
jgi:hypothetical protein